MKRLLTNLHEILIRDRHWDKKQWIRWWLDHYVSGTWSMSVQIENWPTQFVGTKGFSESPTPLGTKWFQCLQMAEKTGY